MKDKVEVTKRLLEWSHANARKFPWRYSNISFYKLLACEIFLWKTQAKSVASFICGFFRKYPKPSIIEKISIDVLKHDIKILGLANRRARQLKQTFSNYNNRNIPKSEKEFRKRFKVGQYIARSVLSIYYSQDLFPVDQNVYRFLRRVFNYEIKNVRCIRTNDEIFLKDFFTHNGKQIIWAVIDFASLVCKSTNPACGNCILNKYCYYIN